MESTLASPRRWLWGLFIGLASVSLGAILIACGFGALILSVTLPQDIYDSAHAGEWKALNAHRMEFDSPDDFSRAERELKRRIVVNPADPLPQFLLGGLYTCQGDEEAAIQAYNSALATGQSSAVYKVLYGRFINDAHADLALLYYYKRNNKRALAELRQVEQLGYHQNAELLSALKNMLEEPERGEFHFELGLELRRILQLEYARQEIQLAYETATDPALRTQAASYLRIKLPRSSNQLSPLTRYYTLAGAVQEAAYNNPSRAAQFYEKAVKEDPDFEWAYSQLGVVSHALGQHEQALASAQKAAELNPRYLSPWLTLGDVEVDRQNYAQAITYYNHALAMGHDAIAAHEADLVANIQNQIGYAYEQMGAPEKAVIHYKEAKNLAYGTSPTDYEYAISALERVQ